MTTPPVTTELSDFAPIGDGCPAHGTGPGQRCPEVDPSGEVCPSELGVEFLTLGEGFPDMLRCVGEAGDPPCTNDTTTGLGFVHVDPQGARLGDGTGPGDPNLVGCCECGRFADLAHPHTRPGSTDTYLVALGIASPPPLPA